MADLRSLCVLVVLPILFQITSAVPNQATLLKAAQTAMGGTAALTAVKSFELKGTLRLRNQLYDKDSPEQRSTVEFPFVIRALLPDHYVERQERGDTLAAAGFAGDVLLNKMVSGSASVKTRYPPDMILQEQGKFGYLMLAMFLRTDTIFPFTALTGDGSTLSFRSATGITVSVDIEPGTSLPTRIRYDAPEMTPGGTARGVGPTVIELSDYRRVSDLTLPHRLTTLHRGRLEAERIIDQIELNPIFSPSDFQK